ncbi:MAG TPA: hypothetical protein VG452_03030 [Egibacteraceae bacterium]|nr:hypothetical protein [Actinomycetota bacterium]HWB71165.1 hypothetical protein [Egibacteraceae bacterium]
MFVQIFQGRVRDPAAAQRLLERWVTELSPGAEGWLGATAGVTSDNELVSVVRFDSEGAARRNSDRPEQGSWWQEMERLFDGQAVFHDCRQVATVLGGGSDEAGFVQVIQGRTGDPERLRGMQREMEPRLAERRPDLIGQLVADHGDGGFTAVAYFISEEQARRGERQEPSPEDRELMERYSELTGDLRYLDLRDPWLFSPR